MKQFFHQFIKKYVESKFTFLLISLVFLILLVPYANLYGFGQWALSIIYALIVIAAVFMLRKGRKRLVFFGLLALINILLNF